MINTKISKNKSSNNKNNIIMIKNIDKNSDKNNNNENIIMITLLKIK